MQCISLAKTSLTHALALSLSLGACLSTSPVVPEGLNLSCTRKEEKLKSTRPVAKQKARPGLARPASDKYCKSKDDKSWSVPPTWRAAADSTLAPVNSLSRADYTVTAKKSGEGGS